jgi:hypothetical protein
MLKRFYGLIICFFYAASFIWGYSEWTCPVWGYMGFSYVAQPLSRVLGVYLFCLAPILWLPMECKRPSMVIYWMLYLMTYVPMVVGVGYAAHFSDNQVMLFDISTLVAFLINGIFYFIPKLSIKNLHIGKTQFWTGFGFILFIFVAYVLYIYNGALSFSNPFGNSIDLYDKRAEGGSIGKGTAVGYPIMWTVGAFIPFLFAYAIYTKKYYLILLSIVVNLILFMTAADKAFLFAFFWLILFYFLSKRTNYLGYAFALFFGLITFFITLGQVFGSSAVKLGLFPITTTVFVRLTGVSAYTATIYYNFFDQNNPYTYYSHVSIFNKFITYPYQDMIGREVGSTVSSDPMFNANANFYITDGLTALGLWGIPVAGLLCGIVFYVIDSFASRQNLKFATLAVVYSGVNIMNASIFTCVLSGGLFWLCLFFYFYNPEKEF